MAGCGTLYQMDGRGHTPVAEWDESAASRRATAEIINEHLRKNGKLADISNDDGVFCEFDPDVHTELLLVPALIAG